MCAGLVLIITLTESEITWKKSHIEELSVSCWPVKMPVGDYIEMEWHAHYGWHNSLGREPEWYEWRKWAHGKQACFHSLFFWS